jgi:four helix bundle protein
LPRCAGRGIDASHGDASAHLGRVDIPPYDEWLRTQPACIREDPLWRNAACRKAAYLQDLTWSDCQMLARHPVTRKIAAQLCDAIGSIASNIAEGYGRATGLDRARFYGYSVCSTRESVAWYRSGRQVLGADVTLDRQQRLQELVRLLTVMTRNERRRGRFPDSPSAA